MSSGATVEVEGRYGVLDGWRGISILFVLAGHLFPLGPKPLQLNSAVAAAGMAVFFTLSGFLITSFLLRQDSVGSFLIRRFFRIVPLAWLCCGVALAIFASPAPVWFAHAFFYANLPPFYLLPITAHIWSLCLEMQFYVGIALLVGCLGKRGLVVLPVLCLVVTAARIGAHQEISIVTWYRIDEILAGCSLALLAHSKSNAKAAFCTALGATPPLLLLAGLLASSHPEAGALNYLRPYLASAMVGATLFGPRTWVARALHHRVLAYVAEISYALYVLHPMLAATWLGSGETLVKYLKRPLLMAALFLLAHVSTRHFERHCIELGRQWATRWTARSAKA